MLFIVYPVRDSKACWSAGSMSPYLAGAEVQRRYIFSVYTTQNSQITPSPIEAPMPLWENDSPIHA